MVAGSCWTYPTSMSAGGSADAAAGGANWVSALGRAEELADAGAQVLLFGETTPMNPNILEPEPTLPPFLLVSARSPCPYGPTSLLLFSRLSHVSRLSRHTADQSICRRMNVGTSSSPICSRVTTRSGGRGSGTTLAAPPPATATCWWG